MVKLLRIGIVGCGAIGSSLAKAIVSDCSEKAQLVSLYDIDIEKAYNLSIKFNKKLAAFNLEDLINKSDLVIEATKADTAFDIVKKVLSSSKDIMIMSVGGIIQHYQELRVLTEEKKAHIFIPSGAICGIDGIKAASLGKINKVILTTRKPPSAFLGAPYVLKKKIRLDNIDKDTVLFEGTALQAIKAFPQNINVAAILSMAGIGPEATIVRVVASPAISRNIHEIEIESEAGKIITHTENVIHPDNPKTSYLAVLSAIATLKQILEPIKIGT
ncbi:MAG: aspartate dehydrogenase [Candidatus Omnitrophota bacterium]|nr:aspartate dehydrogenase [Candidatus Omnitrophota bacterium]